MVALCACTATPPPDEAPGAVRTIDRDHRPRHGRPASPAAADDRGGRRRALRGRAACPARRPGDRPGPGHRNPRGRRPGDRQPGDLGGHRRRARPGQAVHVPGAARRRSAALAEAGIDVASMANNHALDYGRERWRARSTRSTRPAPPLTVVGLGRERRRRLRAGAHRDPGYHRGHHRGDPGRHRSDGRPDRALGRHRRLPRHRRRRRPAAPPGAVAAGRRLGRRGRRLPALGRPGRGLPDRRPALARSRPGRGRRGRRRRQPRAPAPGRRPAGARLRGLRPGQLRLVHPPPRPTGVLTLTVRPPAGTCRPRPGGRPRVGAGTDRHRRPAARARGQRPASRPTAPRCGAARASEADALSGPRARPATSRPTRSSWAGWTTDTTSCAEW